jgi:hypothetical protein
VDALPGEQLDAMLSGKRRHLRRRLDLPLRIKGVHREFEGRARDLSEGGALIELTQAELAGEPGASLRPAEQLALIETHFRDSFDVQFPEQGVVIEAALVRMTVRPDAPELLLLGCQFAYPISENLQMRLGAPPPALGLPAWEQVEELERLTHVGDPAQPASLLVFDGTEEQAGPNALGTLTGLFGRALVARIGGTTCDDLTGRLAGRDLCAQVRRGARVVWEGPAKLLALRFRDDHGGSVEIALACDRAPGRRVRRLLRKRRAA